jgi:hypothetical protein
MFRYVGRDPASVSGRDRSARTVKVDRDGNADGSGPSAAGSADAEGVDADLLDCPECGARNHDDPMVRYCWNCQSTLF